jgi:hypothetical protein
MAGKVIETPLPQRVHLCDENFPYWIKLQWQNPKNQQWEDASPAIVLPLLESRSFSDEGYRLWDPRRSRALLNIPHLLRDPDHIFRNENIDIRGDHLYVQTHRNHLKVAFTLYDGRIDKVILVSSFQTEWSWVKKRVKSAAVYSKIKATQ